MASFESKEKKAEAPSTATASDTSDNSKKGGDTNLSEASIHSHGQREAQQRANPRESMTPPEKKDQN